MKEGTKSVLYGAHSVVHSYYVYKAWEELYGKRPNIKEAICILVHDWGYWGKNYYSERSNDGHAELGANIAGCLFGEKYKMLVLGHSGAACRKYNIDKSKLEKPDEYSWLIAPLWWVKLTAKIERYEMPSEIFIDHIRRNFFSAEENRISGTEISNRYRGKNGISKTE